MARTRAPLGALTAAQVLEMATREGAKALGIDEEVGTLEAGKRADLVVLDGERLGVGGDPATRIVFGGGSRAVRDVMVDGQLVVKEGRSLRFDEAEVCSKAEEAAAALRKRAAI